MIPKCNTWLLIYLLKHVPLGGVAKKGKASCSFKGQCGKEVSLYLVA